MAVNEDYRQTQVAGEVEESARTLAHSTREVPTPSDSYALLGELGATVDHLEQVCRQLSRWHATARSAGHLQGEHAPQAAEAAAELEAASAALSTASAALARAHVANGVVRWSE